MAFNNSQNEYPLPSGRDNETQSAQFLPRYFRTDANKKFLGSTLDQFTNPGVIEKVNAFVGRREAKSVAINDNYLPDIDADRENYQLEPALIGKNSIGDIIFYKDYNDYIGQLKSFRANVSNHSLLNSQEYYAWDPHIDFDKFTNFREYYWLPNGPQEIPVRGQSINIVSTYQVILVEDDDNVAYLFTPNGRTRNPSLKLYRGQTYRFEINTPGHPISIAISRAFQPAVDVVDGNLITTLYEDGTTIITNDTDTLVDRSNFIKPNFVENGILEFTVPMNAPDTLYYISQYDINTSGVFNIYNIEAATEINVEEEIIGKKTYTTSSGWDFSNGMKIYFQGRVTPKTYDTGLYYVEGVGTEIKLIPVDNLEVPAIFTQDSQVPFDTYGFDRVPFGDAKNFAGSKDYVCMNRSDASRNAWARYNRWFHRDVIEQSAVINNQPVEIDENARAKRPIIEFEDGIRLYNHGTESKSNIDLVDVFTKDVFSTIEGSSGYNVDGINLVEGMRILFTADPDRLVNGKIYEVKFITHNNNRQISLIETEDTFPVLNQTVLVKNGNKYSGRMFYYTGTEWKLSQDKTGLNQAPRFELYDSSGYALSDETFYPSSNYKGNRLFAYRVGTGSNDSELGFPLSYKNINNVGDIVFDFDLLSKTYSYEQNNVVLNIQSDKTYLRQYKNGSFEYINSWTKSNSKSKQYVVRRFTGEDSLNLFPIDVFTNSANLQDLTTKVFVNNKFLIAGVDWNYLNINNIRYVQLVNNIDVNDIVVLNCYSDTPKNNNGYYEIPHNLERNPLNNNITEFTLGQVNDHVEGLVTEVPNFNGDHPGVGNLRDLGKINQYGKKFVQHSGPINLPLYHLTDKNANVVNAIRFAKNEYSKFKREFLSIAKTLPFIGNAKDHVDLILKEYTKDKTKNMPFYSTDMLAVGGEKKLEYTVLDGRNKFYALSKIYNNNVIGNQAVYVYVNELQLTYDKDYNFTDNGFVEIFADLDAGNKIQIFEYDNTEGSFVPQTPSKLGMYPKFEPEIFVDNTYSEPKTVIRGHDGSISVGYNDYRDNLLLELELRIYNNIKVNYDTEIFDIYNYIEGFYRNTKINIADLNKIMITDFVNWLKLVGDVDYTENSFVTQELPFTYNYSRSSNHTGKQLPGYWRAVYKKAYDTDRPHTHPWEMLGFANKPKWWESVYGPAPYTSDNLILWRDLETGTIREPGKLVIRNKKFVRPQLLQHLPVNEFGQLVNPLTSGYAKEFSFNVMKDVNFAFGDEAPVETAWRRSSDYAFSLLAAILLNRPAELIGIAFDRSRIKRDIAGNLIYNDSLRIRLQDLVFPRTKLSNNTVQTVGLINYIADYMAGEVSKNYNSYQESLKSLTNQIGFKLAGYADKNKLRLVLDSRTPQNQGNVFVPFENYQIILNSSSPREVVNYSGVIIEKTGNGYKISGYNQEDPFFEYYNPRITNSDPATNVGGISESFIEWTSNQQLVAGKIVRYQNQFYRVNQNHQTTNEFNLEFYTTLNSLPIIGGATAIIRKNFIDTVSVLNYGTVLKTTQEVVDFLLGYENYLKVKGFDFQYFNRTTEAIEDFTLMVKEFLFWTTQNWATSSVIVVSPAANLLKFSRPFYVVDNVYDNFYGFDILKADTEKLKNSYTNVIRDNTNDFSLQPRSTADGIYFSKLPLIQKEHVVVIDNETVFNDTIYSPMTGYRQERIKVVGYRTDNWNGSLNIPGFVYDEAKISEWESWKDYYLGEVVKFKEFYYSAANTHSGTETFNFSNWSVLPERPQSSLKPNWDYRSNQFADFYDLDSDNFDSEQQRLAQHLIGYQKRRYLENIINDDVSQYKFYQGFIQDKGTNNALIKLFDKLSSANQDSIEFYEEWGIRTGQYGALDSFDEVEYQLDETKFRIEPQTFELVNSVDQTRTDLVYQYPLKDVYLSNENYTHNPFPTTNSSEEFSKTGGYVAIDQVNFLTRNATDVLALDINTVNINSYIWVPEYKQSWNVFKHILSPVRIIQIDKTDRGFIATFNQPVPFVAGEIIGINNINEDVNGFWVARKVSLSTVEFYSNEPISDETVDLRDSTLGIISQLNSRRISNIGDANNIFQTYDILENERIWVDNNGTENSQVLDNNPIFSLTQEIPNESGLVDQGFATTYTTNGSNQLLAVGLPDSANNGSVAIYSRISESLSYTLLQTLTPDEDILQAIQSVNNANPVEVVTPTDHNLQTGQRVKLSGLTGITELNENYYYIDATSNTSFNLYVDSDLTLGVDGSAFGLHISSTGIISSGVIADNFARFGASVSLTENGQYLLVGAPDASNVKSKYVGEFDGTASYLQDDIVSDRGTLWRAIRDITAGIADSTISTLSQDWESVDILEANKDGYVSRLQNQGIVYVYKRVINSFRFLTTILSPVPQNNERFGIATKTAFDPNNIYRLFVKSLADNGRLYFINSNLEETDRFVYSKDRRYKGTFDPLKTYYTDEVVFAEFILYRAKTNIFAGSGEIPGSSNDWEILDQYIDYVGFVPNLGDVVAVDSDSVGLGNATSIGRTFAISSNGQVVAISGKLNSTDETRISIYRLDNNLRYVYESNIDAVVNNEDFGHSIAISDNGNIIAIGAITADDTGIDNGKIYVYNYNFNSVNPQFILSQSLFSPIGQKNELFGWDIDFSKNKLAVLSINGDNEAFTTFDSSETAFDNNATIIKDIIKDNGQVYVYQNINGIWIYAEKMRYLRETNKAINPSLLFNDNHIFVGMPSADFNNALGVTTNVGFIIDFRSDRNKDSWINNSLVQDYVDLSKIKTVFLYDKTNGDLITYLDYIDPIQGKIASPAEQELSYKLYYDPAVYNIGATGTGNKTPWDDSYIGKLWWDLSTIKWFNTRQRGLEYKTNNWNTAIPSFEIDVWEWVESDLLPSEWDSIADTVDGLSQGASGQTKYSDDSYVTSQVYDAVSSTFNTKYYYWVKNKRTIPEIDNRKISAFDVSQLIRDPAGQGYRFVAFYENNKFGLHNIRNLIKDKNIILHIEWNILETDNNIHTEYQLLTEGISTSKPNQDIVNKWIDTLVGYDKNSNPIPDIKISLPRRYGILNNPNQSMFVNKTEALKQIVERVNSVLEKNLIVDDFDLSNLQTVDPQPGIFDFRYDTKIATENLLRFVPVARIQTATLQPTIIDGRITNVIITDPGRGYIDPTYESGNIRKGPSVEIKGSGSGAKIQLFINNIGQVVDAQVIKQGKNYNESTTIAVRNFTVLVENDSTIGGFWALYEYNAVTREWSRSNIQKFDTTLYWNYIDWYADGYDDTTSINWLIPGSYALDGLNDNIGDIVKIENVGSGGWLLLEKINNLPEVDYTVNYRTVGRLNGTIQLSSLLYSNVSSGFDNQVYDSYLYDREPVDEIRNIMFALQNDIFVDQLEVEWNKLFFASVRYAISEQPNVDWIFKTSFVKAKHNVGELSQKITFKNDNLSNYQDYIEEVKPYKTKIREYVSAYEKVDSTQTSVTDFDLQPRYDAQQGKIVAERTDVFNNIVNTYSEFVNTYPQKHWLENLGFEISSVEIHNGGSGWTDGPNVVISGGGGPTLRGRATVARGVINSIDVDTRGAKYISAPTVEFDGTQNETGTPAKAVAILGNSKIRSTHMLMKFDRVSGNAVFTDLRVNPPETFTGNGGTTEFVLKWPIDTRTVKTIVTVNDIELLSSEYTVKNIKDTSKGYTRFVGVIEFTNAPTIGATINVDYHRNVSMLSAADRLTYFYNPTSGMPGIPTKPNGSKDLSQVMDGIDYGGVQIDTIDFGTTRGFDTGVFGVEAFDTFDNTFDDEIFVLDGSTSILELAQPLQAGTIYNVYYKSVAAPASENAFRLDSESFPTANTNLPYAVMSPITGDGITSTIVLSDILEKYNVLEDKPYTANQSGDTIIIRKSTSDGSTSPDYTTFDLELKGGNFEYTTAKGIDSGDIVVDGDDFVTPTTSRGPDEQVPGQIVDAVDIRVFNRVSSGQGIITVYNYLTDDSTTEWDINELPQSQTNVIAKLGNDILDPSQYIIDWTNKKFTIADSSLIDTNKNLCIILIDNSGLDILDNDRIIVKETGTILETSIKYIDGLSVFVTKNGEAISGIIVDNNGFVGIELTVKSSIGEIYDYTIFNTPQANLSQISIDQTFIADGVKYWHKFDNIVNPIPFTKTPLANNIIVEANNKILNPGYRKKFVLTAERAYDIDRWQFEDITSIYQRDIFVYINGEKITDEFWRYDSINGRIQLLTTAVGKIGETMEVYIIKNAEYYFVDTIINFTSTTWTNDIPLDDEVRISLDDNSLTINGYVKAKSKTGNNVTLTLYGFIRDAADLIVSDSSEPNEATAIANYGDDSTYVDITVTDVEYRENDTLAFSFAPKSGHKVKIYKFSNHDINEFERASYNVVYNTSYAPEGSAFYIDRNLLTKGVIKLSEPAVSANYVWVVKNGKLLSPQVDYVLNSTKDSIQLAKKPAKSSKIEVLEFTAPISKPKYGFRIFKDMLNRFHFKRLNKDNEYVLNQPLRYYDTNIVLNDATGITEPNRNTGQPGIIWIDGERIEFYVRDGNLLRQLRRGTLGTGVKLEYPVGTIVQGQGPEETIPYKENTTVTDLTEFSDSSTREILLDFDLFATAYAYAEKLNISNLSSTEYETFVNTVAASMIDVFVGGKRLRKILPLEINDKSKDRNFYRFDATLDQDSTQGDVIVPAEYTLENILINGQSRTLLILNIQDDLHPDNIPLLGEKLQVVRKTGNVWNDIVDSNTSLSLTDSTNKIARFIREKTISLPR